MRVSLLRTVPCRPALTSCYELRGKIDGRAEQDWYQAETDLESQQQRSVEDTKCTQRFSKALRETHAASGVVLWIANSWTNWNGSLFRQGQKALT